jgi:SH3 domain protein
MMRSTARLSRGSALAIMLTLILTLMQPPSAVAQTLYISDVLTVPLRSGPSTGHRILHRGLPSGTPLQRLGEDAAAGFTHVRTANGTEGWLETQFLVSEPIARDQLEAARNRATRLQREMTELRQRFDLVTAARAETTAANETLEGRVRELEAELAEIRIVSAGALEQNAENRQLRDLNEMLRVEVDGLVGDIRALEVNQQQRWLLSGGGLVVGGLVLGAWLKGRSRSSGWA